MRNSPCGLLPHLDNLQVPPAHLVFVCWFVGLLACLLLMAPGIYIQIRCYSTQLNNLPQQAKEC